MSQDKNPDDQQAPHELILKAAVADQQKRFPVLRFFAGLFKLIAFVSIPLQLILLLAVLNTGLTGESIAYMLAAVLASLVTYSYGEMIDVLMSLEEHVRKTSSITLDYQLQFSQAIEGNTRKTAHALEEMLDMSQKARANRSTSKKVDGSNPSP